MSKHCGLRKLEPHFISLKAGIRPFVEVPTTFWIFFNVFSIQKFVGQAWHIALVAVIIQEEVQLS